jgi:predicted kinase
VTYRFRAVRLPFDRQSAPALDSVGVAAVIIHLNGWPGSGKLTVAREVAGRLGARLLDNHTLHDVPGRLCDRGTPEYWDLYYQVREAAYRRVLALPPHETVVMTNALTNESDREREAWGAVKELAVARAAPLMAITLECSLDENVRRLASEDRRHRKLTDAVPLIEWRSTLTLLTDESVKSLTIDNTSLSPDQAAYEIVAFVRPGRLSGMKRP